MGWAMFVQRTVGVVMSFPLSELTIRRLIYCSYALFGIVGLVYCILLGDSLRFADEGDYLAIADNLHKLIFYSLDGVHPTAFRAPGYPVVLALFKCLGLGFFGLRITNFLFLGFSGLLVSRILLVFYPKNRLFATAIGISVMFFPTSFYTAATFYPQTFFGFLLLLQIYAHLTLPTTTYASVILGGITGILVLTNPIFILIYPFLLIYLFRSSNRRVLVMLLTASALVGVWGARNAIAFEKFVPFSTNGGLNLLLGNSEYTSPNAGVNVDLSVYSKNVVEYESEVKVDSYYKRAAIAYIMENPIRSVRILFLKFLNYFNFTNTLATKSEQSAVKNIVVLVTYYPLLIICGWFFIRALRSQAMTGRILEFNLLLIALYIGSAMTYAIFFTRIRFRVPFDNLIFLIAGISALSLFAKRKNTDLEAIKNQD